MGRRRSSAAGSPELDNRVEIDARQPFVRSVTLEIGLEDSGRATEENDNAQPLLRLLDVAR